MIGLKGKRGLSIYKMITLILIFSGGFMAGTTIIGAFNLAYPGTEASTAFNATYNKIDQIANTTEAARSTLENSGLSTLGVVYVITGGWNIILSAFGSLSIVSTIMGELGRVFGMPAWFGALIIAIITISVVTSIIGALLFRRDNV